MIITREDRTEKLQPAVFQSGRKTDQVSELPLISCLSQNQFRKPHAPVGGRYDCQGIRPGLD